MVNHRDGKSIIWLRKYIPAFAGRSICILLFLRVKLLDTHKGKVIATSPSLFNYESMLNLSLYLNERHKHEMISVSNGQQGNKVYICELKPHHRTWDLGIRKRSELQPPLRYLDPTVTRNVPVFKVVVLNYEKLPIKLWRPFKGETPIS